MAEWQVIVVGMKTGAYSITVAVNFEEFRKTTVSRFRKLIHQKWPDVDSDFENMRLIFAGKQLDDRKRKVAHLNEEEKKYFEAKVSQFSAQKVWDIKECPSCHSFVERTDFSNLRVHCSVCEDFDFCWQCLSKWSGPTTSSVQCGNPNCKNRDILALRDAPLVTLKELPADIQVPNLRACPICGKIVEHNTEGCKCIVCPRCSEEFCFLCLELKAKCLGSAPCSYYSSCKKPVAPRQTKIPVWSHKQTPSSVPTTTPTPDVPASTDSKRMCIIL